jgi:branched-chain amino acid transport system ATP-binding protein
MVHYIDAVPERFHHPKEDAYLFKALGLRCHAAASLLDRLKQDHELGAVRLRELRQALTRYQQGGSAELPRFAVLVASYAAFHWDHMRLEENDLLPLAKMHLTGEDWEAIDAAFLGHTDPMLGAEVGAQFDALFRASSSRTAAARRRARGLSLAAGYAVGRVRLRTRRSAVEYVAREHARHERCRVHSR